MYLERLSWGLWCWTGAAGGDYKAVIVLNGLTHSQEHQAPGGEAITPALPQFLNDVTSCN